MLIKILNDLKNLLYEDDYLINQQNVNEQMVQDVLYPLNFYNSKKKKKIFIFEKNNENEILPIWCFKSSISMC